jgi:asparagine synthase (glutamine-hydrolysing)
VILDVTDAGRQPMSYADGRFWITFNGEIYNFLELRQELQETGHSFRSQSDTEVILAAYAEWGIQALHRFNGMWAFAIWDSINRELLLARDRFGVKPLHYLRSGELFAFASELKAFKTLDGYHPTIDTESSEVALRTGFGLEGTERTMLTGVRRLRGGHLAIVKENQLGITRWWRTLDHLVTTPPSLQDQAEQFRENFYDAVRLRMRSDVPVATSLSGGFDSSSVVCALAEVGRQRGEPRRAPDWQRAFVAVFPEAMNNERPSAEEAIAYSGVKPHFLEITEQDALASIDRILLDFDDVYITLPTAPWLLYRELRRQGVVVTLDGHGGDELLAGYPPPEVLLFQDAPGVLHPLENLRRLRDYTEVIQPIESRALNRGRRALRALLSIHPALETARRLRRLWLGPRHHADERHPALKTFLRSPRAATDDFELVTASDALPTTWGMLNRHLYVMFHDTILPTILRNFDRLSMAHGVEIRMPYMDWRLVRLAFSLPDGSKVSGGYTKRVAREAMRGRMPESIRLSRRKVGFTSPLPEWLNGPLGPWMMDLVHSRECRDDSLIDGSRLAAWIEATTRARAWSWSNAETAWPLVHHLWFEKNFLAATPYTPATRDRAGQPEPAVGVPLRP